MSRCLALEIDSHHAIAVILRATGVQRRVEAVVEIPFDADLLPHAQGTLIAAALETYQTARIPTIVALPSEALSWQAYHAPPAPADDLPDLVRLQAQRDVALADDGTGFDFLTLEGDAEHPYRVLGFGVSETRFNQISAICEAAHLRLEHLVPTPLGWLASLKLSAAAGNEARLQAAIGVASNEATIWAQEGDSVVLLRNIRLPAGREVDEIAAALGAELRRTLFSLSQGRPGSTIQDVVLIGANHDALAASLNEVVPQRVSLSPPVWQDDRRVDAARPAPFPRWAPLAGWAAMGAAGVRLPVDLLHPHRRPPAPNHRRTYVLAGAALACIAALLAWIAHRNIQILREDAESALAQRETLLPKLEELQADQLRAEQIQRWIDGSTNVLLALETVSENLRPLPLDVDAYPVDDDVVATHISIEGQQLTLQAAARQAETVRAVEDRLRAASDRVNRGNVASGAADLPGYEVKFSELVETSDREVASPPTDEEGAVEAP